MTDANFKVIRELVYDSAGIVLGEHKREMVYSRLARRLRSLNLSHFDEYCQYLESHKEQEFSHFINSITTNLTSFFRENHHFEYLKQTVIPELKKQHALDKRIRVWSAGCSTGEEPYSIAMTMVPEFSASQWDLKVLATDLDSNVLAKAKAGVYSDTNVSGLDQIIQQKGFVRNKDGSQFKIKSELQQHIHFKRLNLLAEWPMKGPFDIIFCRNVVIYFDMPTKNNLMRRYASLLRPGGYLFMGHSESMSREITDFKPLGQTIYQKV